ncbi:MAG: DNA polymerase II large subunit [Candidatus Hadarchaeum sp.]|uniref:DNA polymerase II large subunit n=1 Tax=Candidatus Hadarchaeum sp. TaxID=2883567 RepID=UPI00317D4670
MSSVGSSMEDYFKELERKTEELYKIASEARAQGKDPELEPEIPRAGDLASRVEKLVGPEGVAEVIRQLEKQMPREEVALKIAEMIVDGKFGKFDEQTVAKQAVRTALAVLTEGVVVAPIEGITDVKIKNNFDGTQYLALYFASPIRAAGGTAAALAVLAGDFVRRRLYLSPYKATDREIERFVEEVEIYRTSVGREQYTPPPEDIRLAMQNIPVEITGDPSGKEAAVMAFRDVERVEHNWVRGGAVLAMVEGVLQKAPKIMKYVNKLNIDGWSWLQDIIAKAPRKEETGQAFPKGDKYLEEVIAGRPVFSHPGTEGHKGREGGFRLRYGRARNTGIAAVGIHPATMAICDDFLVTGTQLKTERPGKGGAVTPVDSIKGPTVKLKDGSVVQIKTLEQALELRHQIEEILFLGDILIGYGEFLENNHPLMPAGYCEEWWAQEVERALQSKSFDQALTPYLSRPYPSPPAALAIKISEDLGVPLHPAYTYSYSELSVEELQELCTWLLRGEPTFVDGELKRLCLPMDLVPKRVLEEIGVPHKVIDNQVVIEDHALPLCRSLGILEGQRLSKDKFDRTLRESRFKSIMEIICALAGFTIREEGPTRIGARMGRPEKADPRRMSPPVHMLFPVSLRGGMTRNLIKAAQKEGETSVELATLRCTNCGEIGFTRKCQKCGGFAEYVKSCSKCRRVVQGDVCPTCKTRAEYFIKQTIDLKSMLDSAAQKLGEELPELVKGVIGMTSDFKIPEPIEKGILRAKHGVEVFKDGTIRFDATDVPLTHFMPREIGTPVERLRELGYTVDKDGNPLERDDQLVELKVQDILLSKDGADYLFRASKFIDDLLQKFYGLRPYYNANQPSDLVGHLVIGLAPHTSVGVVGRIIGFTEATVGYAHPYFHAAKRRDCDGDEDCVMLLLDALLNFSKRFLPSKRGGTMDAPLILSTRIDPTEIDKEAHNMDVMARYPLEFYEATLRYASPVEVAKMMETVERRLGTESQYTGLNFSFDTNNIVAGARSSRYKTLETMEEKTDYQLNLARKIRAVDVQDVAERLIEHHFIPDLKGNIRTFASQKFRCINCNQIHRRVPLSGVCVKCGGKLVLTVTRGGVEKYMQIAMRIAEDYGVSEYTKQRLELTRRDIRSTFESDARKQMSLADFM